MLDDANTRFPQAQVEGVLVQQMERGLAEVIVGYRRDPEIGPVVLLGMGGVAAELRKSIAVRVAPVTLDTAHGMIEEIRELELLRGFRNLPRGDIDALAAAIRSMSMLANIDARTVSDAEINPLIVKEQGNGVVAVDGLVVFESPNA
jgi:succinyl-CoA synthetase beta subunit